MVVIFLSMFPSLLSTKSSHLLLLTQVGLWISAGSRYENEKNNGAGFFLEHMAFKVEACGPHDLENSTYVSSLPLNSGKLRTTYQTPLIHSSFSQPYVREPRNTLRLPWSNKWNLWVHT